MNKESSAWLALRVIGLVLLIFGLIQLYEFLLNVLAVYASYATAAPINGTLRLVNLRWDPVVHSIALVSGAIYFLRYGTFAHRLITYEGSK